MTLAAGAVPPDVDLGGTWMFAVTESPVDLGSDPSGALLAAGAAWRPR